jgi:hypothetical protein
MRVAALFVDARGIYSGRDDVDVWDEARDARLYDGALPVVAHPPCQRWGRYAHGGPNPLARRREVGDDGGCFASALANVRRYGGVLEHPAASHAWAAHGLLRPPHRGGWIVADDVGGWTCHVEQGHYGHRARKATWLYAVRCELPSLQWGPSPARARLDEGFRSSAERRAARAAGIAPISRRSQTDNEATPPAFAEMLLAMARSVR